MLRTDSTGQTAGRTFLLCVGAKQRKLQTLSSKLLLKKKIETGIKYLGRSGNLDFFSEKRKTVMTVYSLVFIYKRETTNLI